MSVAEGFRFIGIAPSVDLTERRSEMLNAQTEPFTADDIRGYKVFTALLTQSGGDDSDAIGIGLLTIGKTYTIYNPIPSIGIDFTNVGAPNNEIGTSFIATGTTPNNWGNEEGVGSQILTFNNGAPVATVLENTIGNVWFTYNGVGEYYCNSNGLFTTGGKTVNTLHQTANISEYNDNIYYAYMVADNVNLQRIEIFDSTIQHTDNILSDKLIEIRIYK